MKLYGWFLIILLSSLPAFASEDSDTYGLIDYNFDDIPPIEDITTSSDSIDIPASSITETSTTETSSDKIFLPSRPKINTSNIVSPKLTTVSSTTTLTDRLKETSDTKNIIEGTWLEKINKISPRKLLGLSANDNDNTSEDIDENEDEYDEYDEDDEDYDEDEKEFDLEDIMNTHRAKKQNGKSNASVFDISGVMLRMNLQQVDDILRNRGFKKINARYQIPNFIKWRYEDICRTSGIVGYELTQGCILQKAKKDGFEYTQYVKYTKFESKEEIEVYFTSNFTNNKSYKIEYRSNIANITGNSPKAIYMRNIKVFDFWRRINRKYGAPDNKTLVTWGMGGNKPYLKASNGYLKLEDPLFLEMDYTRMSQEDKRFMQSDFYNF